MILGEMLFVGCCAFYVAWWSIAFHPFKEHPLWLKVALFVPTAACGFASFGVLFRNLCDVCIGNPDVHVWPIIAVAALAYAVLLYLTNKRCGRKVTTELFLIVLWAALQACVIWVLSATGTWGPVTAIVLIVVVLAAAAVSLVCYLRYYNMEPLPAFRIGVVPLVLCGLVMCLIAGAIALA